MDELLPVYATAATIVLYLLAHVATGTFDPFAPVWLFLVGYAQIYVIQAFSYHDWAVSIRGKALVESANVRALWALWWFLAVYQLPLGQVAARSVGRPPSDWPLKFITAICPILFLWGLICAGFVLRGGDGSPDSLSAEGSLFRSFPFVMIVAAVLLIVTARSGALVRRVYLAAGLAVAMVYVTIWMFHGRRSHSLIGVLATVCAYYIGRLKRPSWAVLLATAFLGCFVVAVAVGWRENPNYAQDRSFSGFFNYLSGFEVSKILESLNVGEDPDLNTHETAEYGGFLLMMDTVPDKSDYDYGANYLRVFSTFIPRIIWPTKPIYGRSQWIAAWMAGSEMERDEEFTGPAIGILGATQLNGGAVATAIVLACAALLLRTAYEYFRLYQEVPWAQFWWAITSFNAWFMVVTDDPLVWFYYNWGFSTFPLVIVMWWASKWSANSSRQPKARELALG
jgi:hypothetical protein